MRAEDASASSDTELEQPAAREPGVGTRPSGRGGALKLQKWCDAWRALKVYFRGPPSTHYGLTRSIFLRLLGLVYLIAFVSFWTQVDGLIGHDGVLPAADFLDAVRHQTGAGRYWMAPTLCWVSVSDFCLHLQCAVGACASLLLILGAAPGPAALLAWGLYLSLCTVGQVFLEFQWDALLLETGLLAIFFAPWRLGFRQARDRAPSRTILWLLRWLLFRLMFLSGVVKLASGDPAWRHLEALSYHYQTQPLPTWLAWYAQQLPSGFQETSVLVMFVLELGVPWLIFAGRRPRLAAAITFALFQLLIAITGNYCFFNLLTVVLCIPLLDDAALSRLCPRAWRTWFAGSNPPAEPPRARRYVVTAVAGLILLVSSSEMFGRLLGYGSLPAPLLALIQVVSPLRSINTYGLFAVMTTRRLEIVVEGSNDHRHWEAYEFKWKPGDLKRRPGFVAPHQPRLDWQMWFAVLGRYQDNPWFMNLAIRLLQGTEPVLALLEKNPFPKAPPRYLRAVVYEYHFTDRATRQRTGEWWWREPQGLYCPVLSLSQDDTAPPRPPQSL